MRRRAVPFTSLQVLSTSQISRGHVVSTDDDGTLLVEDAVTKCCVPCDFLRTSSGPMPAIDRHDIVLYVYDASVSRGCVLGIVVKYGAGRASDNVTVEARERIELRCGSSSLTMTKEGSVVVKGEQVVSRASGVNKIKGAAVKIN